jgi:hypothetical protein
MGRLLGKFILLISGLLAFTGGDASAVQSIAPSIHQIEEVTKITPLYLRLALLSQTYIIIRHVGQRRK